MKSFVAEYGLGRAAKKKLVRVALGAQEDFLTNASGRCLSKTLRDLRR
jgi:hypothetical protein